MTERHPHLTLNLDVVKVHARVPIPNPQPDGPLYYTPELVGNDEEYTAMAAAIAGLDAPFPLIPTQFTLGALADYDLSSIDRIIIMISVVQRP